MAKSILDTKKGVCYLCGAHGFTEVHHVYEGNGRRALSEKFGLKIDACPWCHRLAKNSVHKDAARANKLKAEVQAVAMAYYGWTAEQFRELFRKSYI